MTEVIRKEYLNGIQTAVDFAEKDLKVKITKPTMINWCLEYGLGSKLGGRWVVDKKKLIEFVEKGLANK